MFLFLVSCMYGKLSLPLFLLLYVVWNFLLNSFFSFVMIRNLGICTTKWLMSFVVLSLPNRLFCNGLDAFWFGGSSKRMSRHEMFLVRLMSYDTSMGFWIGSEEEIRWERMFFCFCLGYILYREW